MCGICGHFNFGKSAKIEKNLTIQMNQVLNTRGPDAEGYFEDEYVSFGHKRLAIIDLNTGTQPMFSNDKSVVISFNGEIYNYRELKKLLVDKGHKFNTNSDTEVIINSYIEWGEDCLNKLNGMFAFSIWDKKQKKLLLARDHFGQKPLFWHYSNHGLSWSSDIRALLLLPWISKEINYNAIDHYLSLQYIPDPFSIYKSINKLSAGHKISVSSVQKPAEQRWWQLDFEPKTDHRENEIYENAKQILNSTISRTMIADVPFGIMLSGGIDSSLITSIATKQHKNIKTFSIGFSENKYSELNKAKQISSLLGTEHHEFYFGEKELVESIQDVAKAYGEPNADPAALALFHLAKQTSKYVKVALTGDGGDETAAGYTRYVLDRHLSCIKKLPTSLVNNILPILAKLIPENSNLPDDKNPSLAIRRILQFYNTPSSCSILAWSSYFSSEMKKQLYKESLLRETELSTELINKYFENSLAKNLLDKTLDTDQKTYLAGNLLVKTDRMTMAHSLEARAPLLNKDWAEFSAKLPEKYKIRGVTAKLILRKILEKEMPTYKIDSIKSGFSLPIGLWFKDSLHDYSEKIILNSKLCKELFNSQYIEKLFTEHKSGKLNHSKRLWALLMLCTWEETKC